MKKNKVITPVLILVVVLLVGGIYCWWQMNPVAPFDCAEFGADWTSYSAENAEMSFCYPVAWGEVEEDETIVGENFREGTEYNLHFKGLVQMQEAPRISIETKDFELTGDNSAPGFDWESFDNQESEAYVELGGKKKILKGVANYYNTVYDFQVDSISYRMKGGDYNFWVNSGSKYADDLEKVVESMNFK